MQIDEREDMIEHLYRHRAELQQQVDDVIRRHRLTEGLGRLFTTRRSLLSAIAFALGGLAIGRGWASHRTIDEIRPDVGAAALPRTRSTFPLVVEPGKRHLEDASGRPFFMNGDTAWGLITQLVREDVDRYLDDRRARGFNTILVMLIQASYGTNAPANAYGQLPFSLPADYSAPNEAYFAHADWVLRRAAKSGFLVLLTPSYLGPEGDSAGWYHAMLANGPDKLRKYGEYLGRRYRNFANVLWVHGGDYTPPRKELVRVIAEGIQHFDPRTLHTFHGAYETAALDCWQGQTWLQVNNIHTSLPKHWSQDPVYAAALQQYAREEPLPFFLIEGVYENEHGATERHLRTQAYQSVLSGAAGQIFGNNPIWHFNGVGPQPFSALDDWFSSPRMTWQQALGSHGAQSMTHLHNLWMSIPWWRLEPDTDNALLVGGLGSEEEHAVGARATDRSFAILYLPSNREVTVDPGQLAGPRVAARWYDPANGQFSAAEGSPFPATGSLRFKPVPVNNSSGFSDWVLILESLPSAPKDQS